MDILSQKPNTKRPAIVQAATSLFAARGIDAVSTRHIAQAAGVQEPAIYRHFANKEALAREIFLSWYGWHCRQIHQIVEGTAHLKEKLRALVRQEFTAAERYPEAYLYFCANEDRFISSLPSELPSVRDSFIALIQDGQARGEVRARAAELRADMLSGALCEAVGSWVRRRQRGSWRRYLDLVTDSCWRMLAT
jgi:AcrR family transcriptional regulator